jgi:hypothetical protein
LTGYAVLLEPDAPKLYNDDGSLNWELNATDLPHGKIHLREHFTNDYSNTTKNLFSNLDISYFRITGVSIEQ